LGGERTPLLSHHAHFIKDKKPDEFMKELRESGVLEDIEIMVAVDATRSNEMNGALTYGGRSLHDVHYRGGHENPYAMAMRFSTKFLQKDTHGEVPLYYFGSEQANAKGGVHFVAECKGAQELQQTYTKTIGHQTLSGPTLFIPTISEALRRVKETNKFHVLLILTDGMVQEEEEHYRVLNQASKFPLSIVCVGVGDGPWDEMQRFDRKMPKGRVFDNFHFVAFSQILQKDERSDKIEEEFFYRSFMKIPHQYHDIKKHLNYKQTMSTRHLHEAGHIEEDIEHHVEHMSEDVGRRQPPPHPQQYQYQPLGHPPGYTG